MLVRILIADDDLTSRLVLAGVLKKRGHDVLEAVDGTGAWSALQRPDAPALAILDWMMPGMEGPDIVRRVRALRRTGPPPYIIMLTSRNKTADVIAALEAGANDFLAKPFDAGELCARVEVGGRMLEMQAALATKIEELSQALGHVKTLRGILPICANCKKIRDDQGYWKQVEVYVRDHTEADFSHGLCPPCLEKLYPEFDGLEK